MALGQAGRISGQVLEENLLRQNVNLDFRNNAASTPLIKLDVVNSKIGINTSSPGDALTVNGTLHSGHLKATTKFKAANLEINANGIQGLAGSITLDGALGTVATGISTDQLLIRDNKIYSYVSNAEVTLSPNGTGTIELLTDTNITGNLHATGNITADGNITIGNDGDDSLTLSGELVTDIIPDVTATSDLGSTSKLWTGAFAKDVTTSSLTVPSAIIDGVNLTQTQGNILYVTTTGSDTNAGEHQANSVLTLTKALTLASAGDTIQIASGTYVEVFPLTVPIGVTVSGDNMRNVIITPTGATESNDAFLVNGEVTIENLTIKDYYYNSGADTGYGFRFKSSSVVSSRSPYIRNVTTITKGSVTSASDPRGFDQGDAGRGTLIDGASVTTISKEAGMLFYAVTFISPGQQAITLKNDARVEWLNSFTYFASIGVKSEQGSTGFAGQGVTFGGEMRCIGSANVYGTKGIVADGANSIIYLVEHNFSYVGSGKDITNDKTLHVQVNEVTELNNANVMFTSFDQGGVFRAGGGLTVDQTSGDTVIDSTNFDFSGVEKLTVTTGGQSIQLKGEKVQSDFIKISGSTIESIVGDLTFDAGQDDINLTSNTSITGNLDVSGNVTLAGTLVRLGNADTDTIDFNADIEGNLIPNLNSYDIGKNGKQWNTIHASNIDFDNLSIQGNKITTDESNADLELSGNGSSFRGVRFTTTEVLGAVTTTDTTGRNVFGGINVNGQVTVTGNINNNSSGSSHTLRQVSTSTLVANSSNNLTTFDKILFNGNKIKTTTGNDDLNLVPAGTGKVSFLSDLDVVNLVAPSASVSIANASGLDKVVAKELLSQNITLTGDAVIEDIAIADNIISTRTSNSDLELRANGSGSVRFQEAVVLVGDVITPTTSNSASVTTNNLGATTLIVQTLNSTNKQIIFEDMMFAGNRVTSTDSNSNLEFTANGSGVVKIKADSFQVPNNNLTSNGAALQSTIVTNTLTTDFITATGITGVGSSIFEGISISGNVISTKDSNADLELRASRNVILRENVIITNDLTVGDTYSPNSLSVSNTTTTTGNLNVTGSLTVLGQSTFENIFLNDNTVTTLDTNSNLELRASGTGVVSLFGNTAITNTLNVNGMSNLNNVVLSKPLSTNNFSIAGLNQSGDTNFDKVRIRGNTISTNITDSNIDLRASGTGKVRFLENVSIANAITVSGKLSANNINIQDNVDLGSLVVLSNINIDDNFLETTISNSDLELRANGSGTAILGDLIFTTNSLSNDSGNLQLDPTNVLVNSYTGSMILPKGTTAQENASQTIGSIRYNTSAGQVVGYGPTSSHVLGNALLSDNFLTGIELSGLGISNDINFKINGSIVSKFTSNNKTEFNKVELSGITLDANNISVTTADTDLTLNARHQRIIFNKFEMADQTLFANNGTVTFENTGDAHTKFNDNKALVIPAGGSAGREATPETGHTRYNTDLAYLEVFTGSAWTTAVGSGGAASAADMADILNTYVLAFG